jgi:predicted hydrolase (HD superfamily)
MKVDAYKQLGALKDFDYDALKQNMKLQKHGLLTKERPYGKVYADQEVAKRAKEIFEMQRDNQLLSINFKVGELNRVD